MPRGGGGASHGDVTPVAPTHFGFFCFFFLFLFLFVCVCCITNLYCISIEGPNKVKGPHKTTEMATNDTEMA